MTNFIVPVTFQCLQYKTSTILFDTRFKKQLKNLNIVFTETELQLK